MKNETRPVPHESASAPVPPPYPPKGAASPAQAGFSKMNRERAAYHNRETVLLLISTLGAVSQSEIARLTQLRRSTVFYVLRDLIQFGLVRQGEPQPAKRVGPKERLIEMDPKSVWAAGLSLTASGHQLCLLNAAGHIVTQQVFNSSLPVLDFLAGFTAELDALTQHFHLRPENQSGLTVCLPGIVNRHTGYVLNSDSLELRDVALGDFLRTRFRCEVIVERNAICGAYAEKYLGRLSGTEQFLYLLTRPEDSLEPGKRSYSFGLAIINQGEVLRGWNSAAGEFHGLLTPGGVPPEIRTAGGPRAKATELKRFLHSVGASIGGLVNLLDPQLLVVAGDDELWSPENLHVVQETVGRLLTPIPERTFTITRSRLGLDGIVQGAALMCLHQGLRQRLATAGSSESNGR